MRHLRLIGQFARASAPNTLAYRANFGISLLHSLLNLATAVLGTRVLFGQVETIRSPGFLFTWLIDGIFQMARYPVRLYPDWLRLLLTWVVPVGVMTTVPAQALTGKLRAGIMIGSVMLALVFLLGASALFRIGLRRYASASS
jgi:ABC-2 type transport system permease protein